MGGVLRVVGDRSSDCIRLKRGQLFRWWSEIVWFSVPKSVLRFLLRTRTMPKSGGLQKSPREKEKKLRIGLEMVRGKRSLICKTRSTPCVAVAWAHRLAFQTWTPVAETGAQALHTTQARLARNDVLRVQPSLSTQRKPWKCKGEDRQRANPGSGQPSGLRFVNEALHMVTLADCRRRWMKRTRAVNSHPTTWR